MCVERDEFVVAQDEPAVSKYASLINVGAHDNTHTLLGNAHSRQRGLNGRLQRVQSKHYVSSLATQLGSFS